MNSTNPEIYVGQAAKQNALLRGRMEKIRSRLQSHISQMKKEVDEISQSLEVEYTDWVALLKWKDLKWVCLQVVNSRDLPDDMEDEWDLALPIPSPESLPEFNGW